MISEPATADKTGRYESLFRWNWLLRLREAGDDHVDRLRMVAAEPRQFHEKSGFRDPDVTLLDMRINPGNSGGPVCGPSGHVIGMGTAKTSGVELDSYGMAIPVADLQQFAEKHLPGYNPAAAEDEDLELEWDQVDKRVAPAVFMVLKVKS